MVRGETTIQDREDILMIFESTNVLWIAPLSQILNTHEEFEYIFAYHSYSFYNVERTLTQKRMAQLSL